MDLSKLTLEEAREGQVFCINKPLDWTSFDVVAKMRNALRNVYKIKKLKVGHAGTLDPKATGLLIICIGRKTKEIETYMGHSKVYEATIKLGATTPSYDLEKEEDHHFPTQHITEDLIQSILLQFRGEIDQTPPIFSALKKEGKPLYEYARKNQEVEIKSRKITIHQLEMVSLEGNLLKLVIHCGKGTYIRSLARDIGLALDSGGYLVQLKRTQIGEHSLEDAWEVDEWVRQLKDRPE